MATKQWISLCIVVCAFVFEFCWSQPPLPGPPAEECLNECLAPDVANINRSTERNLFDLPFVFVENLEIISQSDGGQFQRVCRLAESFHHADLCFTQCPSALDGEHLRKAIRSSSLRIPCLEYFTAIQSNRECLSSAQPSIASACGRQCQDIVWVKNEYLAMLQANEDARIQQVYGHIDNMCSYMTCRNRCAKKIIEGKCGSDGKSTAQLHHELTMAYSNELVQAFTKEDNRASLPASCLGQNESETAESLAALPSQSLIVSLFAVLISFVTHQMLFMSTTVV